MAGAGAAAGKAAAAAASPGAREAGGRASAEVRFVEYVDPDVRRALTPRLARPWVAEESLRPVPPGDRALWARARALADAVPALLRAELLPEGDLLAHVRVDPFGRAQFVASTAAAKVRVAEDFAAAIVRRRPVPIEGGAVGRGAALRQGLRAALAIPLASADRKPMSLRKSVDLGDLERDAVFAIFDPPYGQGFVGGRFESLQAFGNGKVLLVAFEPIVYVARALGAIEGAGAARPAEAASEAGGGASEAAAAAYAHPKWGAPETVRKGVS